MEQNIIHVLERREDGNAGVFESNLISGNSIILFRNSKKSAELANLSFTLPDGSEVSAKAKLTDVVKNGEVIEKATYEFLDLNDDHKKRIDEYLSGNLEGLEFI